MMSYLKANSYVLTQRVVESLVVVATALILTAPLASAATGSPTRAEYVETVEPICKSETEAHKTILRGVERMVNHGKLKQAAPHLTRASVALREAMKKVAAVPRPSADKARLAHWFAHARTGVTLLRKMGVALRHGGRHRMQTLARQLLAEAKRANTTVVGFDFDYCRMDPSRFV